MRRHFSSSPYTRRAINASDSLRLTVCVRVALNGEGRVFLAVVAEEAGVSGGEALRLVSCSGRTAEVVTVRDSVGRTTRLVVRCVVVVVVVRRGVVAARGVVVR